MKSRFLYFTSAFLCGMVVMGVELSASRLLAPYFGNSIYVWTNVIGIILLALAGGYVYGGRLADKHPESKLYFSLIWVTGLWVLLIPFVSSPLSRFLVAASPDLAASVRMGSLLAISVLFLVPMILLGMMVPFTLKLQNPDKARLASVSGQLSMISTLGSLIGTFLPTFLLVPVLGTTKTFVFLGLVLLFLAAYGLRNFLLGGVNIILLSFFFFVPSVYADSAIIGSVDSPYGFVYVTEDEEGLRRLHIDTPLGTQSLYDPNSSLLDKKYYYNYFALLPSFLEEPKTVLILGHAAGTFTRLFNTYYPELQITGVELDPEVTALAKEYMGLSEATVTIVHADARAFLLDSEQDYDLILVDTYHGTSVPAHLATEEFFQLCAEHLTEDGLLALNAASTEGEFLSALENSMAQPFGTVFAASVPNSFNVMLLTRANPEYAPVQPLAIELAEKWKQLLKREPQILNHDEKQRIFEDDRLAEVELLNEAMFMQLLERF